eukprot:jgi/Mesen1/9478/ME000063S08931
MALPVVSSDVMQIEASPSFEMHSDMLPPAQYGTKVSQYESAASVPSETLNQLVATLQAARAQVHDSAGIEKALSAALAEAGFSDIRVGARRRKADNPDGSLKRARIAEDVNKVRPKGPQPSAKCRVDGCNKYASFGYAGDKKVRCLQHIEEGMVDVKHVRRALEKSRSERCHADGCEKYASFGWPNSPGRIRCGTHMELGMIDRKHANREPKTLRRKGVRTDHRPVVNSTNIPPPIARLAALAASAGAHPQEGGMEHMLGLPQSQPQPHPVAAPDPALDPQQQQMLIQQKHVRALPASFALVAAIGGTPEQQLDARMEGVGVGVGVDDAEGGHVEVDEMGAVDDGVPEGAEEEAWLEAQPGLAPAPAPPGEGGGADRLALAPHQMIFATPRPHLQRGPRANHVCAQPGCKNTGKFNFPGGPRYCDEHRSDGMSFPKCGEEGCTNMPYYAFPMEHAPTRCKRHRQEGMVDKRGAHPSHRCNFGGCATIANFNYPGGPGRWCSKHKVDGMVNVKEKRQCAVEGCVIRPYFGYVDDERATRCAAHKEPGMIDIRNGKCEVDGCTKLPGYGFPVTPGPRARTKWDPPKMIRCSKHRLDGMVGLKNPRCEMDACVKQAVFAFPGERARRCTGHRLDGMLNPGAPALCADLDCRKAAKWGYEKDDRASRCKKHKLDGMMAWWWIVKMKKAASRGDPSLCMEVALALDDGPSPAAADPAGADNDMEARLDEAASATSIFRDVEEGEGPLKIGASAEARCRRQEEAEENGVPAVHDARLTRGAQHQPPALLSGLGLGGVGAGHELALGGGSKAPIPAGDPQLAMPPLQGGEERLEREGSNQQQRRRRQQRRRSNTLSPAGLRGAADLGVHSPRQPFPWSELDDWTLSRCDRQTAIKRERCQINCGVALAVSTKHLSLLK